MSKAKKIIVLGVDGMDPAFTKYMLDRGELPNIERLVNAGGQREDLVMLGGLPTITPPMWTTLATGAYASTHGITCFWNQDHTDLSKMVYALDSTMCKAEAVWNPLAEAGYKTLVWHWPGSSWPPTSDSKNLHVVDGTQPGFINFGTGMREDEVLITADMSNEELKFYAGGGTANTGAGCLISDLDVKDESAGSSTSQEAGTGSTAGVQNIMLSLEDGDYSVELAHYDVVNSPLKEAKGWLDAPEGAGEFTVLLSGGRLRRPCLLVQNEAGQYDTVKMYRSKKDAEPILINKLGELSEPVLDDVVLPDGERVTCYRGYKYVYSNEDASIISFYASRAFTDDDTVFHPKHLYKDVIDNVGYFITSSAMGGRTTYFTEHLMLPMWDNYMKWQADAIKYLIKQEDYDVVFSHVHNVDGIGHNVWPHATENSHTPPEDVEKNREYLRETYRQTDRYIGEFMSLYDNGWTIFITSDHGIMVSEEDAPALMGDPFGVNAKLMDELGFTILKRDEDGNILKEIDWTRTKAVATRGNHIWINLKGKYDTGIVEPEDKWAVEEEIINALNAYRDPQTGRRIISLILRNKDGALLGASGPEFGDLVYWVEEGFNRIHGDSLSTTKGVFNTSVSPIFIAAGPGIKKGYKTKRVIREVDLAPTIATLMGTRMPAECEGAPVYQIIE